MYENHQKFKNVSYVFKPKSPTYKLRAYLHLVYLKCTRSNRNYFHQCQYGSLPSPLLSSTSIPQFPGLFWMISGSAEPYENPKTRKTGSAINFVFILSLFPPTSWVVPFLAQGCLRTVEGGEVHCGRENGVEQSNALRLRLLCSTELW